MLGQRVFTGFRALAIFAATLSMTTWAAAQQWNETVLHNFGSGFGRAVSRIRPDPRCGRQSLRHDRIWRHLSVRGTRVWNSVRVVAHCGRGLDGDRAA